MRTTPAPGFTPRTEAGVLLPERTPSERAHRVWDWRVWWIPVVPGTPVYFEVPEATDAVRTLDVLATYDLWLTEQDIMPDVANAGGIQRWRSHEDPEAPRSGTWEHVEWDEDLGDWVE